MERNYTTLYGKNVGMGGTNNKIQLQNILAEELNTMGPPTKTSKAWLKVIYL